MLFAFCFRQVFPKKPKPRIISKRQKLEEEALELTIMEDLRRHNAFEYKPDEHHHSEEHPSW